MPACSQTVIANGIFSLAYGLKAAVALLVGIVKGGVAFIASSTMALKPSGLAMCTSPLLPFVSANYPRNAS